jgi:hypothetical protein
MLCNVPKKTPQKRRLVLIMLVVCCEFAVIPNKSLSSTCGGEVVDELYGGYADK